MNKIFWAVLIILALSITTSCTASHIPENQSAPEAPMEENEIVEEKQDELEVKAEVILDNMTLEEKVGQLMIVGFPQDTDEETLHEYIDEFKVAGFILFNRNYKDFDSLYNLVNALKERNSLKNPLPLFISIDEEGGTVSRLPKDGTHFPDAQLIGKTVDPILAQRAGEVIGLELRASGINLNLAPVLDIVSSEENKLLIKRSYGSNAETVSLHGASFISGLQSAGIIATPKHFPGHGSTIVDSHSKLPMIGIDEDTLQSRELLPFKAALDAGSDAIMVGHIAFPMLDSSGLPATMSSYFLTDILRKELGFMGIAVSDDVEMSGYTNENIPLEECILTSFNAGIDVFIIGHTKSTQDRVQKTLKDAYLDGRISAERLNESVLRIIKVKLEYELSDTMYSSLEEARKVFGSKEHKAVLQELNNKIKTIK